MQFLDYVNPDREDYHGDCCDIFCDECDTYFEICLQHGGTALTSKKCFISLTTKERESDRFSFGSTIGLHGEKNPLVYNFDDTWQVRRFYCLRKRCQVCFVQIQNSFEFEQNEFSFHKKIIASVVEIRP